MLARGLCELSLGATKVAWSSVHTRCRTNMSKGSTELWKEVDSPLLVRGGVPRGLVMGLASGVTLGLMLRAPEPSSGLGLGSPSAPGSGSSWAAKFSSGSVAVDSSAMTLPRQCQKAPVTAKTPSSFPMARPPCSGVLFWMFSGSSESN